MLSRNKKNTKSITAFYSGKGRARAKFDRAPVQWSSLIPRAENLMPPEVVPLIVT